VAVRRAIQTRVDYAITPVVRSVLQEAGREHHTAQSLVLSTPLCPDPLHQPFPVGSLGQEELCPVLALKFVYYLTGKKATLIFVLDEISILAYEKVKGNL
jgi:hypothetical protein